MSIETRVVNGPVTHKLKVCVVTMMRCQDCGDSLVLPKPANGREFIEIHALHRQYLVLDPSIAVTGGQYIFAEE